MAEYPPTRDPSTGCLVWAGSVNSNGYGTAWTPQGPRLAHVVAYELAHGAIPTDRPHVDHLCRNRLCVAPAHLEAVSSAENMRRKTWGYRASKVTRCPRGHDLWKCGRRTPHGGTVCKICSGI